MSTWRKSARSGSHDSCVEVRFGSGVVDIRDSKNPDQGHLTVSTAAWAVLVAAIRRGELDLPA